MAGQRLLRALVHPRARHWPVLVVGAAAVTLHANLPEASGLAQPLYVLIAVLSATVLTVSAVIRGTGARVAWTLIAASQVSWAIGEVVWTLIDLAGGTPDPSVADVFYVSGYPLLAVGLGLLLQSESKRFDWGDLVDVAIITLAAALVLWPTVFQPTLAEGWSWATLISVSYSSGDVLLLGLLAALIFYGGRRSTAIWLMAGSLLLVFVADLIYYVPDFAGGVPADAWSSAAYLTAYVLIAAAGLHPAVRRNRGLRRAEGSPLRRLGFVGVALLTLPAAFLVDRLNGSGSTDWRAVVAIEVAVSALVVLRLSILLHQVERTRDEASTARNRFETVFESAGVGITITKDGRLLRTNPAFLEFVGYASEELAEMQISDIVHPDDIEGLLDPETIEEGQRATFGRRFVHRNGSIVHALVNLTFSRRTGMAIAVVEDVTERMELEAQLRETQKMNAVGRLAGGIAHDFNNILTVVSGHAELLRDQLPPEAEADVNIILDSVQRANDLTRQLLTFSRTQAPTTTVIQPADIFRDTEILIRNVIGSSVILQTTIKQSSPAVVADPVQLGQVVLNLAVNARDAMPDGGTLTLTVDDREVEAGSSEFPGVEPGLFCRVTVQDTGSGMDEATRTRIFEPFFTTKSVGKGTGLGLATTYGIVAQAGGHIFVDSELGRGTRFQILLPAAGSVPTIPRPVAVSDRAYAA